ncbi:ATP-binding protein [Desulfovibrio inopinatus]|uniref:ATP-binding protein n=1 Tax=Desulfovibrio inopinatus TaxID=102109 RepID=UPI000423A8A0|nr:ATP-binding protein [Desulfovibrio inopinatus]
MEKKYAIILVFVLLALSGVVAHLGYRAKVEIQSVVTEQFNKQQLDMAERIAGDLQDHMTFLIKSITALSRGWRGLPGNAAESPVGINMIFDIVNDADVVAMGRVLPDKSVKAYATGAPLVAPFGLETDAIAGWASRQNTGDSIYLSHVFQAKTGRFKNRLLMMLATPISVVEKGETRLNAGALFFVIDPVALVHRYSQSAEPGRTSHSWVIDESGYILGSAQQELVGKNILRLMMSKEHWRHSIRLQRIVQNEMMTAGKGVTWYDYDLGNPANPVSRRLLAYCPALLSRQNPGLFWSVAVTAPEKEVQSLIGTIITREWIIVLVFQLVVFGVLAVLLVFSLRWSRQLNLKVDERTNELRIAHDKLSKSLNDLIEAQEELLRTERFAAIGEAAAHLSHEIKNPLMLMGGFAQQVMRQLKFDREDSNGKKLAIIVDEAKRLESLLVEVRDFTRPNPAKLVVGDFKEVINKTLDLMSSSLSEQGISITAHVPQTPLLVAYDEAQCQQVLLNLVKNSAEALSGPGEIAIDAQTEENSTVVTVSDNGPGIAPGMLESVFVPFNTTKEHGTGLGLCVSKRIIEDHKGTISVQNGSNGGAIFRIRFPEAYSTIQAIEKFAS